MKTAVDASVVLDVLSGKPPFAEASRRVLRQAYDSGALVACDIVWAEIRPHFASLQDFEAAMRRLGILFEALTAEAASLAGETWAGYCRQHRRPRARVIADFLIGSHARLQADQLLTRDRGFYREAFAGLRLLAPQTP